ncbi:cyclic nucleotide-binding domain-containing protein [Roseomonas sp. HF4]|uniref:cyclic nucleotide-binding domain-containing protein n=1 Tax=Roseomonas sp. HF4 TaxID=2562313 RepID=UPI0014854EEC|nr:cyclic nucleotide-binding domain-containing protein [Roseomonas sp. HF4]
MLAASTVAVWSIANTIAYAELIAPTADPFATRLFISALLLGLIAANLVIAMGTRIGGLVVNYFGATAILHAAATHGMEAHFAARGVADEGLRLGAALVASAAMTVAAGLAVCLIARMRLGAMVRFLPHPVSSGFFCGIGAIFMLAAFAMATGTKLGTAILGDGLPDGAALRLAVCVGIAGSLVVLPHVARRLGGMPALFVLACLAYHAVRMLIGQPVAEAQASGWLLGPFQDGMVLTAPPSGAFLLIDWHAIRALLPYLVSSMLLTAVTVALMVTGTEAALGRELDVNRQMAIAGAANIVSGLAGAIPTGHSASGSTLLARFGATSRWNVLVPVLCASVVLLQGSDLLGLVPRPVLAALIMAFGFEWLVLRSIRECRALPRHEAAILLLVASVIAVLGILQGLLLGLGLALVMFVWAYRRVPVIRGVVGGDELRSSVARPAAETHALQAHGGAIVLFRLQGYLFFLNAEAVREALAARVGGGARYVLLDFQHVVGLDSSAVEVFRRIEGLLAGAGAGCVLSALRPAVAQRFAAHGVLAEAVRLQADSADRALERAEDMLLAEAGAAAGEERLGFVDYLNSIEGAAVTEARLAPFVEAAEIPAGTVLIREGAPADGMYYLEDGRMSAVLLRSGEPPRHLRTMRAGTLFGELALLRGGARTASVIAAAPSRVWRLPTAALRRMEAEDPALAVLVQRALMLQLADKLVDNTRAMDLALR